MRRILLLIILFNILPLGEAWWGWASPFTLVIDAGHGGKDAGAVGAISKEKNINLSVALAFGQYVERNCPDVKVVYTRKTDVFVELNQRARIANKSKADLFISVHTNALPKGRIARGFECYTLGMHRAGDNLDVAKRENSVITMESDYQSNYAGFDPNSAESYIMFEYMQDKNMENSVKLAKNIQSAVCSAASRENKGVHQAGFLVLRETSMPSCLVELGFISTPDEERQLNDPIVQNQMAYGLYQAFLRYRGKHADAACAPIPSVAEPAAPEPVQDKAVVETDAAMPEYLTPASAQTEVSHPAKQSLADDTPVFKVQLVSLSNKKSVKDPAFKGIEGVEYYQEGNIYKYTCGSSTDYREIQRLQKSVADKFPQAFIVSFRNGSRMDIKEAIRIWREKK